ncbi:MAG TPA: FecR domain-containing protein, partial [Cyclobacteriaceae bacterium]|nr:FecR domain-containing protein [Cyclobacteriaceae bacterium]
MNKTSLIYKVLSAQADESEKKELEEWMAQSQENKIEYSNLQLLWEALTHPDPSLPKTQLDEGLSKIRGLMQLKKLKKQNKRFWAIMLLLIVTLLLVFIFLLHLRSHSRNGHLVFKNISLEQIVKTLEKEYCVRIELENKKISSCPFTGVFYQTKDIEGILETIDKALALQHRALGNG